MSATITNADYQLASRIVTYRWLAAEADCKVQILSEWLCRHREVDRPTWQPIATAPRDDETRVLVRFESTAPFAPPVAVCSARWIAQWKTPYWYPCPMEGAVATHWMPLPSPDLP